MKKTFYILIGVAGIYIVMVMIATEFFSRPAILCSDYCPDPSPVIVYDKLENKTLCRLLLGRPVVYYGWGEFHACLAPKNIFDSLKSDSPYQPSLVEKDDSENTSQCFGDCSGDIYYEAKVIGQGRDCKDLYLIEFKSEYRNEIATVTESEGTISASSGVYYVDNLLDYQKVDGKEIKLKQVYSSKGFDNAYHSACTTLGPAYEHIMVFNE